MLVPTLGLVTGCVTTVMARFTVAGDAGVIPGAALESRRGMTEVTIQIGGQVISVLTSGGIAIVATYTAIDDPCVIEGCR